MNRGQRGTTPSHTSNSPLSRAYPTSVPRSPIKTTNNHYGKINQELGLTLERVIGTTCQSVTCFDSLASAQAFAYTAGAAAVVATIDDRGVISQRFYRANPVQSTPLSRTVFGNGLGRDNADARHKSPLQNSPRGTAEWSDSPIGKQGNVKERVKAATTLSFSSNGRYLAVGETGYRPRVLIFSLDDKAPYDIPVAVIPEHTFGVQAVAFSPDSRYLASLGSINDGFLYIWNIDEKTGAATLVASNKCTNAINQMVWVGQSLVTVGLRFVKIWRPNEVPQSCTGTPELRLGRGHRPLAGRNAVLGDLLEAAFTCVVPISGDKAILCTDTGDVCILDDGEKSQRLIRVANVNFSITAACLDSSASLLVTGLDGTVKVLDIDSLQHSYLAGTKSPSPGKMMSPKVPYFVAIGAVADLIVTVDSHHGIQLRHRPTLHDDEGNLGRAIRDLPAHSDAVLGVRALSTPNDLDAAFLTWSAGGTVIFWSLDCKMKATLQVPMNQSVDMYNIANELKSVTSSSLTPDTISGDRYGMLRVSDSVSGVVKHSIRAHSGEITDIAICEDTQNTLVASSSRDRTIQLFAMTSSELDLVQTLDEHAGSVTCVLFAKKGSQLLSCSSDRTVVVRDSVRRNDESPSLFVITRTITLKNSPTSMRLSLYDDAVLLSATDRCIQLVNTQSGRVLSSFKAVDGDGGDAVIMSSLAHLPSSTSSPIIAGVSSSDKSVRLYSEDGSLLARDWGHTEGVTDIAIIQSPDTEDDTSAKIVTVAADGTIFIWDTLPTRQNSRGSDPGLQVPSVAGAGSASAEQPLRKVISHSEIARFQRSNSVDMSENEPFASSTATSTILRSPTRLKHRPSRLIVKSTPRLEPSPLASYRTHNAGSQDVKLGHRSPSPHSPLRAKASTQFRPKPTTTVSSASRSSRERSGSIVSSKPESSGFGSVAASTEQLCRTLKAYRQRLEKSSSSVAPERLAELENELESTIILVQKTLGKKMGSMAELDRDMDKMSMASPTSLTESEGRQAHNEEEATPRQKRMMHAREESVETVDSESTSRCSSSQETSFISADSYQSNENMGAGEERAVSGVAESSLQ